MHRRAIASTMSVPCPWQGASAISVRPAVKDRRRVSGSAGCEQNRLPRRVETSTRLHLDGADGRTAVAWSSGLALPRSRMRSRTTAVTAISPTARALERHAWRGDGPRFGYPVQVPRSAPGFRCPFRPPPFSQGNRFPFARALRARWGHRRRVPTRTCQRPPALRR